MLCVFHTLTLRAGKNKDNVDLRLGKASLEVDAPAKVILDVVWNLDNHRVCDMIYFYDLANSDFCSLEAGTPQPSQTNTSLRRSNLVAFKLCISSIRFSPLHRRSVIS